MADGTLRLVIDYPPAAAQDAFRLFGAPGTPVATARIKTEREKAQDKPKGGKLAQLAARWCRSPDFVEFIRPIYDRAKGGDGSGWGDVSPQTDFDGSTEAYARHCICVLCDVQSRAELDSNEQAAAVFHERIRKPFAVVVDG